MVYGAGDRPTLQLMVVSSQVDLISIKRQTYSQIKLKLVNFLSNSIIVNELYIYITIECVSSVPT